MPCRGQTLALGDNPGRPDVRRLRITATSCGRCGLLARCRRLRHVERQAQRRGKSRAWPDYPSTSRGGKTKGRQAGQRPARRCWPVHLGPSRSIHHDRPWGHPHRISSEAEAGRVSPGSCIRIGCCSSLSTFSIEAHGQEPAVVFHPSDRMGKKRPIDR